MPEDNSNLPLITRNSPLQHFRITPTIMVFKIPHSPPSQIPIFLVNFASEHSNLSPNPYHEHISINIYPLLPNDRPGKTTAATHLT
ncbi:hypothetical protein WN48_10107 [Eufriesea mexicana]|nr:hypothetical protein WN48_10107 [Eufriesea mexicana]